MVKENLQVRLKRQEEEFQAAGQLALAREYAQVKNVGVEAVLGLVMGTVTASGIPEAIAAAVLVAVIGKVLLKVVERV